jgi:hypothetical protein
MFYTTARYFSNEDFNEIVPKKKKKKQSPNHQLTTFFSCNYLQNFGQLHVLSDVNGTSKMPLRFFSVQKQHDHVVVIYFEAPR